VYFISHFHEVNKLRSLLCADTTSRYQYFAKAVTACAGLENVSIKVKRTNLHQKSWNLRAVNTLMTVFQVTGRPCYIVFICAHRARLVYLTVVCCFCDWFEDCCMVLCGQMVHLPPSHGPTNCKLNGDWWHIVSQKIRVTRHLLIHNKSWPTTFFRCCTQQ